MADETENSHATLSLVWKVRDLQAALAKTTVERDRHKAKAAEFENDACKLRLDLDDAAADLTDAIADRNLARDVAVAFEHQLARVELIVQQLAERARDQHNVRAARMAYSTAVNMLTSGIDPDATRELAGLAVAEGRVIACPSTERAPRE